MSPLSAVENTLVDQYRALGDPTRFKLVKLLLRHEELTCSELAERVELTASTITHHTQILERCGLISVRPEGSHRLFRANRSQLEKCAPALVHQQES